MKLDLYTIYDCTAEEYGPIFEAKNDAIAVRKCKMEFKGVAGLEDFKLYSLGYFDHETGVAEIYAEPLSIIPISEIFNPANFKENETK